MQEWSEIGEDWMQRQPEIINEILESLYYRGFFGKDEPTYYGSGNDKKNIVNSWQLWRGIQNLITNTIGGTPELQNPNTSNMRNRYVKVDEYGNPPLEHQWTSYRNAEVYEDAGIPDGFRRVWTKDTLFNPPEDGNDWSDFQEEYEDDAFMLLLLSSGTLGNYAWLYGSEPWWGWYADWGWTSGHEWIIVTRVICEGFGLAQVGDILGPWIVEDIRAFIEQLTTFIVSAFRGTAEEKDNFALDFTMKQKRYSESKNPNTEPDTWAALRDAVDANWPAQGFTNTFIGTDARVSRMRIAEQVTSSNWRLTATQRFMHIKTLEEDSDTENWDFPVDVVTVKTVIGVGWYKIVISQGGLDDLDISNADRVDANQKITELDVHLGLFQIDNTPYEGVFMQGGPLFEDRRDTSCKFTAFFTIDPPYGTEEEE